MTTVIVKPRNTLDKERFDVWCCIVYTLHNRAPLARDLEIAVIHHTFRYVEFMTDGSLIDGFSPMLKALFGGKPYMRDAQNLYGAVMARSRSARFYAQMGVPDTFDGRFEMLILHLYAINTYLREGGEEARAFSQAIFDRCMADMDAALREAAVGDQTVPKRLAKMVRVIHGRARAFDDAIAGGEAEAVAAVFARNLFGKDQPDENSRALAAEMMALLAALRAIPHASFLDSPVLPVVQISQEV